MISPLLLDLVVDAFMLQKRVYKRNGCIVRNRDEADQFYILKSGSARMYASNVINDRGMETEVAFLQPG